MLEEERELSALDAENTHSLHLACDLRVRALNHMIPEKSCRVADKDKRATWLCNPE